jgi:hypothetical protein
MPEARTLLAQGTAGHWVAALADPDGNYFQLPSGMQD